MWTVLTLASAMVGTSSRAEAHDIITATAYGVNTVVGVVAETTRLVTLPVFHLLGLEPHSIAYNPPHAARIAAVPVSPPPFVVATPATRPLYGAYYAQ